MVIFGGVEHGAHVKVVNSRVDYSGNLISNLVCDCNGSKFLMTIVVRPLDGQS